MTKTAAHKRRNLNIAKKGCFGKIPHKSMLAADFILSKMNGRDSHKLEIYKCKFCSWYHIGHNNKTVDRSKNEKNNL